MGYLQGLDSRNSTAVDRGTGGFLQLATYIAGLSGGSWTVGSLAANNWPTIQSLQDDTFNLTAGLFNPADSSINQSQYFADIDNDMLAKQQNGYQLSFIDAWGHLLSGQFLANGASRLWSSISQTSAFTDASYPFPLVTALQYIRGQTVIGGNGTIWEMNPYETGSWDKNVAAFAPTRLFGSTFNNGQATRCVSGFDELCVSYLRREDMSNTDPDSPYSGYIVGLSSAIFNSLSTVSTVITGPIAQAVQRVFPNLSNQVTNVGSFDDIHCTCTSF
jgi:lysophospholipase